MNVTLTTAAVNKAVSTLMVVMNVSVEMVIGVTLVINRHVKVSQLHVVDDAVSF